MANMADVTLKNRKGEKKSYSNVEGILLQREGGGTAMYTNLVIDDALSSSSTNPVQNKVVTKALGGTELKFFNVGVTVDLENMSGTSDVTAEEIIGSINTGHQIRVNAYLEDGSVHTFLPTISVDSTSVTLECVGVLEPDGVFFSISLPWSSGEDNSWVLVQHNFNNMLSVTYQELVGYAENGQLVPGMQYRITDYETIIRGYYDLSLIGGTGYLPYATSAGHPFDIIVTADSRYELNENARAIRNEDNADNGYFSDSNLGAWELKYTIYNDPNKHAWADPDNGRGVIYWMKDEFNNDAGYDFKNIQFIRYGLSSQNDARFTTLADNSIVRFGDHNDVTNVLLDYLNTGEYHNPFTYSYLYVTVADYDFSVGQNILGITQYQDIDDTFKTTFDANAYYTFSYVYTESDEEIVEDFSLTGGGLSSMCHDNHIGMCLDGAAVRLSSQYDVQGLNGIVWIVTAYNCAIVNNYISDNCWAITIRDESYNNYIGIDTASAKFGGEVRDTTIQSNCTENVFNGSVSGCNLGNSCDYNVFGMLSEVTLGNDCEFNVIGVGNAEYNVTFGYLCDHNVLEGSCVGTTFANGCSSNYINSMSATLGFLNEDLTLNGTGQQTIMKVQDGVNNITVDGNILPNLPGIYELKLYDMNSMSGGTAVLSAWTGYNSTLDYLTEDGGQNWTTL